MRFSKNNLKIFYFVHSFRFFSSGLLSPRNLGTVVGIVVNITTGMGIVVNTSTGVGIVVSTSTGAG